MIELIAGNGNAAELNVAGDTYNTAAYLKRTAPELDVEDIQAEIAGNPLRNRPDLRNPACTGLHRPLPRPSYGALKHKEVGKMPTSAGLCFP